MSYSTLSYGSTGKDVEKLQKQLGIEADGIYGSQTQKAVQQYQQDNGLQVDGIAGNETLGHLYGAAGGGSQQAAQETPASPAEMPVSAVTQSKEQLEAHLAKQPQAYQSVNNEQLQALYDEIVGRKPVQYDLNADVLYQQLLDKHKTQGKVAMMDTAGQAAGLTGGYGNTYGQRVGQQAYQEHIQAANDQVPELERLAMEKYQLEGDRLVDQYGMVLDKENRERSAWQDQQNAWLTERDYLTGRHDTERSWEAQQEETAYSRQENAYNKLVNLITTTGYNPSQEELKAAGMSASEAAAYSKYYADSKSGSGGGRGYEIEETDPAADPSYTGNLTYGGIKMLQKYIGAKQTGVWDKQSQERAQAVYGNPSAMYIYDLYTGSQDIDQDGWKDAGYSKTEYDKYDTMLKNGNFTSPERIKSFVKYHMETSRMSDQVAIKLLQDYGAV